MDIKQSYIDEIINDRSRGASELARRCLEIASDIVWRVQVSDVQEMKAEITTFVSQLQQARPSMAPIRNLLQSWLDDLQTLPMITLQQFRLEAMQSSDALCEKSELAVRQVVKNLQEFIQPGMRIMTFSNSSTVFALLSTIAKRGISLIAPESSPLCEGRVLAEKAAKLGIESTIITDAQIGLHLKQCNVVVVGADTVLQNGDVINKAGTSMLGMLAREYKVPFYVAYESFKHSNLQADEVVLEKMEANELGIEEQENLHVSNYYFDITPAEYISAWVSENGVKRTMTEVESEVE